METYLKLFVCIAELFSREVSRTGVSSDPCQLSAFRKLCSFPWQNENDVGLFEYGFIGSPD